MTAPTSSPNHITVQRQWGPLFVQRTDHWMTYSLVFVIPFTRRRASVQWQLVVFRSEVDAS